MMIVRSTSVLLPLPIKVRRPDYRVQFSDTFVTSLLGRCLGASKIYIILRLPDLLGHICVTQIYYTRINGAFTHIRWNGVW
jgi:hypothetical protein